VTEEQKKPDLGDVWDADWPEDMSEEERVRSVASTLREPRGAEWIASRADADAETVRDVLEEMEIVEPVVVDGETRWRPDVTAKRERTRQVFERKSETELLYLREEIELREWDEDDELGEHRRQKREYLLDVIEDVLE